MAITKTPRQKVVVHRLKSTPRSQNPRIRFPWRSRKRRSREALSEQQKQDLKKAREKKKQDLRDALMDAHDTIWDLAQNMEQTFGGHKTQYYFRLILQNVLTIKKEPRKITLWNTFVGMELKSMNNGIVVMLFRVMSY